MKKIIYPIIDETIYYEQLNNGLKVYLIPKTDYNKTFAVFSTNYGGLDNEFVPYGEDKPRRFPCGIAHFLEHKLFEMKDGKDASLRLSTLGASANAFTSYNQTSYLFSATSNVKECVMELINFVQEPYFTDENVLKEQGIIEQEIRMYEDYPEFRAQTGILKNMYEKNDIREDIVGTIESISSITKEHLYACYETFYQPANMQLVIIGNFPLTIIDDIKQNQYSKEFKPFREIQRVYANDKFIVKKEEDLELEASMPKLMMGIRLPFVSDDFVRKEIIVSILLTIVFGDSSHFKEELLEEELINDTFGFYADFNKTASYVLLMSDTNDLTKLEEKLREMISKISSYPINEAEFIRIRNSHVGKFIGMLNSLEAVATNHANYSFNDIDMFLTTKYIEELQVKDVLEIQKLFQDPQCSTFRIIPSK